MSVRHHTENFGIVSDEHGGMQKCDFFFFRPEMPFLGKFGPKNQNCHMKVKFGIKNNSNTVNARISALGAYLRFRWALNREGCL